MKRQILWAFLLSLALVLSTPFFVFGQENLNYVAVKGGFYNPTDDLDDLDRGFAGEIAIGKYYSPTFAVEGGIGRFETDGSEKGFIAGLGNVSLKTDVSVTTIFVAIKRFRPIEMGELFIGGGIGIGFADTDLDISISSLGSDSVSDDDTVFGFQFLAGANFNISEKYFLGIEGKYLITNDAEVSGTLFGIPFDDEANANGYIITAVLGFKF